MESLVCSTAEEQPHLSLQKYVYMPGILEIFRKPKIVSDFSLELVGGKIDFVQGKR